MRGATVIRASRERYPTHSEHRACRIIFSAPHRCNERRKSRIGLSPRICHHKPRNATKTLASEHVLLDPQVRHDLAADFLDRGMGGVERGNVLVAENAICDDELALAAVELGI